MRVASFEQCGGDSLKGIAPRSILQENIPRNLKETLKPCLEAIKLGNQMFRRHETVTITRKRYENENTLPDG